MAKMYDLIIKAGLVVSSSRIQRADLGIKGQKIFSVAAGFREGDISRLIDAYGKDVMPSLIDVYAHPT